MIPYPGSKSAPAYHAVDRLLAIPRDRPVHYVEPFAGSAAVALRLMRSTLRLGSRVTLADLDRGVVALWTAVRDHADELADEVERVVPSVAVYREAKGLDGDMADGVVACARRKVVLHRLAFGARGATSGGPIGGADGQGANPIDLRWKPDAIRRQIRDAHLAMLGHRVEIVHRDGVALLARISPEAFVYCDPPYAGAEGRYRHGDRAIHARLARVLHRRARWALTYGDTPAIRALYGWAQVEPLAVRDLVGAELAIVAPSEAVTATRSVATARGMAAARASGVRLGRPRADVSPGRVRRLRGAGWSWRRIAARLDTSPSTARRSIAGNSGPLSRVRRA